MQLKMQTIGRRTPLGACIQASAVSDNKRAHVSKDIDHKHTHAYMHTQHTQHTHHTPTHTSYTCPRTCSHKRYTPIPYAQCTSTRSPFFRLATTHSTAASSSSGVGACPSSAGTHRYSVPARTTRGSSAVTSTTQVTPLGICCDGGKSRC